MKKTLITLIFSCIGLFSSTVNAEVKTFIKEYTYQASEFDSKATCRILALDQVKRLLLEELGTYLESTTEIKNLYLTKDTINSISAGVVQTAVLEEKWDGKAYWLKVEIQADPDEVAKSIESILSKTALLDELQKEKQKTDEALKEISELKKKKKGGTKASIQKVQKEYEGTVKKISDLEGWQNDLEIISKGWLNQERKNYDDAIYYAEKILLNKDTKFKCDAFLLLGRAYRGQERFDESLEVLSKSLEFCGSYEAENRSLLGKTYMSMKKYDMAIIEFRKTLPLLYERKAMLGTQLPRPELENDAELLRMRRDWTDESIADIHGEIASAIMYRDVFSTLEEGYDPEQVFEWPKEALEEFEKILKLRPNSIRHLRNWSEVGNGQFQEIIEWCDKLLKLRQNEGEIYFIRGLNYARLANHNQAISDISKAIVFDPYIADYYVRRAFSYSIVGIYKEASKDFDKAIELDPAFSDAYLGRGILGVAMGKVDSIEDIKIAARLDNKKAQKFLKEKGIAW